MYQRKSNLHGLFVLLLDGICITVSLILANYIRNGRLFDSDNLRMNFGMLLASCLTVYFAMNLLKNRNQDMLFRGPLHELVHII